MSEAIKLPTALRTGSVLDDVPRATVPDLPAEEEASEGGPSSPVGGGTDGLAGNDIAPAPADGSAPTGGAAPAGGAAGPHADHDQPSLVDLESRWQETADSEAWQPPAARRRRRRVRAGAVVVLVGLLAVIGYGAWRINGDDQLAAARSSALAAGKADATLISTYSYQDFAAYSKRIVATSTKQFSANYTKDAGSLGTILAQYKAGSKGTVLTAGLEPGATTSRATVDVFLNETVTNSKDSGPQSERARMVVTLVRHGGHWIIANAIVE
jgi:Mce-associated membrane protein